MPVAANAVGAGLSHSCYCGGRPAVAAVVMVALQTMMAAPQMA